LATFTSAAGVPVFGPSTVVAGEGCEVQSHPH
jgi:hypothetical protein